MKLTIYILYIGRGGLDSRNDDMVMMPVFHPGTLCLYDSFEKKRFSLPDLTILLVLKVKVEIVKSLTGVILLFLPFHVEPNTDGWQTPFY